MSYRFLACITALALVSALSMPGQTPAAKAKSTVVPKAPDGHSDLQGVWTNATLTPMERPAAFAGKATATEAEAKAFEQRDLTVNNIDDPNAPLLAAAGS